MVSTINSDSGTGILPVECVLGRDVAPATSPPA